jgi:hypothetical protein
MDEAEYQDDLVLRDDVVHHAVIADPKAMKRVAGALDRLRCLAGDSP